MNPSSSLRIKEVVIRYQHGTKLYTLTLPQTTRVNSIFLDRTEAQAAMKCIGMKERHEIKADGQDWRDAPGFGDNVQALEAVDLPFWVPDSKVDLCIHDDRCMWFCLQ